MQKMRLHLMMDPCSRGPEPCDGGDASRSLSSHLSREQEQWRHRGMERWRVETGSAASAQKCDCRQM